MSDWDHYFASLRKYLDYFRAHIQILPKLNELADELKTISDSELAGLLSWTSFATSIARKDQESRRQIYEERSWNCIESVTGLLSCPIPLVLKGAFYDFLAALAIDEVAAINIWNALLCEGICVRQPDGRLTGIQQELDERESQLKFYDCTKGFLTLVKELFTHKTRPSSQQVAPYLQFIINSVICNFFTRSYSDSRQMWMMVKVSLDSLYEPLKTFYATPASVEMNAIEVQILTQLLNDSPLSRTLLQIIAEGSNRIQDESSFSYCPFREGATCSAIRLLYTAISSRSALADAIRAANSNIMVVSLESMLFSAIPHQQRRNSYLLLLLQYVNEAEQLSKHTFYVWQILKEAIAQRPSLQPNIVQVILPYRAKLIASTAALSIFSEEEITIGIDDLPPTNVDSLPQDRVRGEVCKLMLEVFNESMESDPDSANVVYALMNFDLSDLHSTRLEIPSTNADGLTCLHNLLEIILQLTASKSPLSSQFSGLYEPALRLILRMCSINAASSGLLLRFLRSQYDLIYRLVTSPIFCEQNSRTMTYADSDLPTESSFSFANGGTTISIVHKSIQGIILELIALEFSSLVKSGHIEQPRRYLKIIFAECGEERMLLWSLLDASRVFVEDLHIPHCNKFDPRKVDELLSLCIRRNSCNIDQFDVLYLHLLLNSEINCIMNTEIGVIREEARSILDYCVRKNARNLLEGACTHLLRGWISLMNVLSIHAPLSFIDIETHQHLLVDALFLLRDYCGSVEMSGELAESVAVCFSFIVRAICNLFTKCHGLSIATEALLPILQLLLQCIVLPGYSKAYSFKIELYSSCLRILSLYSSSKDPNCNPPQSNPAKAASDDIVNVLRPSTNGIERGEMKRSGAFDSDPMVPMLRHEHTISNLWKQLIEPITHELVQTLVSDIVFAPIMLKMLATATFVNLLLEDSRMEGRIVREFVISGSLQCTEDTLLRLQHSLTAGAEPRMNEDSRKKIGVLAEALKSLSTLARTSMRSLAVSS